MKKSFSFVAIFVAIISLTGCEFQSYNDYELSEYTGLFNWTEIGHAAWSYRVDHAGTVFDNKMWISGGYNSSERKNDSYLEDLWSSSDGINWELIIDNAPWKGRRGHCMITYNDGSGDAMYIIGGFEVDEQTGYRQYTNDVWKSADGSNWNCIRPRTDPRKDSTVTWDPRFNHTCVVAEHGGVSYIYLIGGSAMMKIEKDIEASHSFTYFNDVWRSTDGISWQKMANNDFGIRSEHAAAVDPATQRIYIYGGMHGEIYDDPDNDGKPFPTWDGMWYSDDGELWEFDEPFYTFYNTKIYNNPDNTYSDRYHRAAHEMMFYNDALWIFPGKRNTMYNFRFAVRECFTNMYRTSNVLWHIDTEDQDQPGSAVSGVGARESYVGLVFNDQVWILGGNTGNYGPNNDIWCGSYIK